MHLAAQLILHQPPFTMTPAYSPAPCLSYLPFLIANADDDDAQEGSSSSSSVDVNALLAELEQQVLADVREHLAALEEYEAEALQDQVAYIEQLQQQQQAYQAPSPQQQQQQQASPGQWQQAQHQQHVPQLASPGLMQRSPGFFLPQASPGQQHTPSPAAPLQQQQQQPGLGLLCPVCRAAHMVARHGCLVCPAEGYVLNVAAEGLGLEDLARRLGQVQQVRRAGALVAAEGGDCMQQHSLHQTMHACSGIQELLPRMLRMLTRHVNASSPVVGCRNMPAGNALVQCALVWSSWCQESRLRLSPPAAPASC
jgi:hypothetical protein